MRFKRQFNQELNGLKNLAKNHPWKKGQVPAKAFAKYSYAMRTLGVTDQNFYKEAIANKSNYIKQDVPKHLNKGLYPIIDSYDNTPSNPKKDLITPKKLYQKANNFQNDLPYYSVRAIKDRKIDNSINMVDVHSTSLKPTKYINAYDKKHNKVNFKPAQHQGNQPKHYIDAASMSLKDMNKLNHLNHLNYAKSGQLAIAQRKYNDVALNRTVPKTPSVTKRNDEKQINSSNKLFKKYRKDYLNLRHNNPKKLATSTSPKGIARVTYRDKFNALLSRQNGITHYSKKIKNLHHNQTRAKELDQSPKLANKINMYSGRQAKAKLNKQIKKLSNPESMKKLEAVSSPHDNLVKTAKHQIKNYSVKRNLIEPSGIYTGEQLNAKPENINPLNTKEIDANFKSADILKNRNKINKHYTHSVANKLNQSPKLANKMNMYSGLQANQILANKINKMISPKNVDRIKRNGLMSRAKEITKGYQNKLSQLKPNGIYTGEQLSAQTNLKPLSAKAVKQNINMFNQSQRQNQMPGHRFTPQEAEAEHKAPSFKHKEFHSGQSKKISPSILRGGHHPHF